MQILVVDDEPHYRQQLKDLLEQSNMAQEISVRYCLDGWPGQSCLMRNSPLAAPFSPESLSQTGVL